MQCRNMEKRLVRSVLSEKLFCVFACVLLKVVLWISVMKHALILYLPVKTGTVSRMTGGAGLIYKC